MDIFPKGSRESRQNPHCLSYFCQNNVIMLGVFSIKLTKLCSKEVYIFFHLPINSAVLGHVFFCSTLHQASLPPSSLDKGQSFALFFKTFPKVIWENFSNEYNLNVDLSQKQNNPVYWWALIQQNSFYFNGSVKIWLKHTITEGWNVS